MFADGEIVYAPELVYVEVVQGLHRCVRNQTIPFSRAEENIDNLLGLEINRFPHILVLRRVWELRNTLSAYDALYVSIAETLKRLFLPVIASWLQLAGIALESKFSEAR
jgi:predicted nucleic acid-binding protein